MDITVFEANGPDAEAISNAATELVREVNTCSTFMPCLQGAPTILLLSHAMPSPYTISQLVYSCSAEVGLPCGRDLPHLEHALTFVRLLSVQVHEARQFTDTANFTLRCKDCQIGVKGEKEAVAHAKATGHANFGEY